MKFFQKKKNKRKFESIYYNVLYLFICIIQFLRYFYIRPNKTKNKFMEFIQSYCNDSLIIKLI